MEQLLKPLHLACSSDELRPSMQMIKINNNNATATDGHVLVKINLLEVHGSCITPEMLNIINGKCIHKEVWKEIHKCDFFDFTEDSIYCHKNGIKKSFEYSLPDGQLWNEESIIEDIAKSGEEKQRIMKYNPHYIHILSKIFQSDSLTFSFSKSNKGTFVYPYEGCGMFAVLMPVMMQEVENRYYFK